MKQIGGITMITKFLSFLIDHIGVYFGSCILLLLVTACLQFVLSNNRIRILRFLPVCLTGVVMLVAILNIVDAYNYGPDGFGNMISVGLIIWSFLLLAMCLGCLLGWIASQIYVKCFNKKR